jgi:hypothetical protein
MIMHSFVHNKLSLTSPTSFLFQVSIVLSKDTHRCTQLYEICCDWGGFRKLETLGHAWDRVRDSLFPYYCLCKKGIGIVTKMGSLLE